MVGYLDHVEMVLDDNDRIALTDQFVEHVQQAPGVFEMQTSRRLIEDIECATGTPP